MILFQEDWLKYPNAIIDTKTRNKSFYIQAIKYKMMGVKNHAFMLALHNPDLQGVNPHDDYNLTNDQKDAILVEIMINPWYYFREILMIGSSGGDVNLLKANRGNIALFWLFFNHMFIILVQIRQTGKSLNTDALKSYALFFGTLNTAVTFLVNSNKNRQESLDRIRAMEKGLPSYLKVFSSDDINNMERIFIRQTSNRYETAVMQNSEENAKLVHRGKTSPFAHIDEAAYIKNIKESLTAMLKAGGAARKQAAASGALYGTIVSTTAGYKDTPHGSYVYTRLYKRAAVFWEKGFFDCKNLEELRTLARSLSTDNSDKVLVEMNHRQLGLTDEWLAREIIDTVSEGRETLTDYFNIWVDDLGATLLTEDDMKKITESKLQNYNTTISDFEGYVIRWYITEEERKAIIANNEPIVAGMDTSEALGNDDISLVITSVKTGEVLGAADFNNTNTTVFGMFVAELLLEYRSMTLIIERRSTGTSIIDSIIPILLQRGINPLLRLFNWAVNDMHLSQRHKDTYIELDKAFQRRDRTVFDRHKKLFGFSTSGGGRTARNKLYSETFKAAVKYTGSTVRDLKLVNQLLGLKIVNGRVDHGKDDHDDMVIGWLLGFWLLKTGTNLKQYGMNINNILISIKEVIYKDGEKDVAEMLKMKKHNNAMDAIAKLTEVINSSKNGIEITEAKMMMKRVSANIDYANSPSFNIDVYIQKLENEKRLKKRIA